MIAYYITILITVLSVANADMHIQEAGRRSSGVPDVWVSTFNDIPVKFKLKGVPDQGNANIRSDNITLLLTRYACKQDLASVSSTMDGGLEVLMEYKCKGYAEPPREDCSKIWYTIMIAVVCMCIFLAALYARKASTVEGNVRWRMWSVPLHRYVMGISTRSDFQTENVGSNVMLFPEDSISNVLITSVAKKGRLPRNDKM